MLPTPYRLKSRSLFNKALSAGQVIGHSSFCVVVALPRPYPSNMPTRIGFIVSRKVSNRSNKRNKIRRRIREIVRTEVIPGGYLEKLAPYSAVVIIARQPALEVPFSTLKETVLRLISQPRPQPRPQQRR